MTIIKLAASLRSKDYHAIMARRFAELAEGRHAQDNAEGRNSVGFSARSPRHPTLYPPAALTNRNGDEAVPCATYRRFLGNGPCSQCRYNLRRDIGYDEGRAFFSSGHHRTPIIIED
jgi:hypothetical protein